MLDKWQQFCYYLHFWDDMDIFAPPLPIFGEVTNSALGNDTSKTCKESAACLVSDSRRKWMGILSVLCFNVFMDEIILVMLLEMCCLQTWMCVQFCMQMVPGYWLTTCLISIKCVCTYIGIGFHAIYLKLSENCYYNRMQLPTGWWMIAFSAV